MYDQVYEAVREGTNYLPLIFKGGVILAAFITSCYIINTAQTEVANELLRRIGEGKLEKEIGRESIL